MFQEACWYTFLKHSWQGRHLPIWSNFPGAKCKHGSETKLLGPTNSPTVSICNVVLQRQAAHRWIGRWSRETCCISSPVVNKYLGLGKFELKDLKMNCFYRFLHDSLWKSTSSFIFEKVPVNPFRDFFQPPKHLPHSNAQSRCHCSATHCASRRYPSWVGCEPPPVVDCQHRGPGPEVFCLMQGIQISDPEPQEDFVPAPGSWCQTKYTKQLLDYSCTPFCQVLRNLKVNPEQPKSEKTTTIHNPTAPVEWTWVPGCRKGIIGPSNFSCEFSTNETHVLFIPLETNTDILCIHGWQLVGCQKHQINSPSPPVLHMGATSNYMSRFHQLFLGGFILPQNGLKLNFLRDSLDVCSRKNRAVLHPQASK